MNALRELVDRGGPVMIAIMAVAVLLYERCFNLLLFLITARRRVRAATGIRHPEEARTLRYDLQDAFRQQRIAIDAMITAAPLLGLLGTVMGMIAAFNNLSGHGGERSMEGLARGISEVLVATESGLAVAIPAVLLLYYAHRQLQKGLQRLAEVETTIMENQ